MKLIRNVLPSILALLSLNAQVASAADYQLDDQHTSIVFAASHLGLSNTYGMFGKYAGKFSIDMQALDSAKFEIVIDAASLDTKSEKRDEHLRGPDFFDAKQFPNISFVSKSVVAGSDANSIKVVGDLTLHGQTKEATITMTKTGEGKGPYGDERIGFSGRLTVKRSEFGMATMVPNIGDDVSVFLSFEGIKQ